MADKYSEQRSRNRPVSSYWRSIRPQNRTLWREKGILRQEAPPLRAGGVAARVAEAPRNSRRSSEPVREAAAAALTDAATAVKELPRFAARPAEAASAAGADPDGDPGPVAAFVPASARIPAAGYIRVARAVPAVRALGSSRTDWFDRMTVNYRRAWLVRRARFVRAKLAQAARSHQVPGCISEAYKGSSHYC